VRSTTAPPWSVCWRHYRKNSSLNCAGRDSCDGLIAARILLTEIRATKVCGRKCAVAYQRESRR
jgi:hypothetical protein